MKQTVANSLLPPRDRDDETRRPGLWRGVAIVVIFVLAVKLGLFLRSGPSAEPAIWPAIGVGVAVLVYYGLRQWPLILTGSVLSLILEQTGHAQGRGLIVDIGVTAVCFGQALLAAWGLRRCLGARPDFGRPLNVLRFLGIISLATGLGGLASTALLAGSGPTTFEVTSAMHWWLGHTLGILAFTPLLLLWGGEGWPTWSRSDWLTGLSFQIIFTTALIWASSAVSVDDLRVTYRLELLVLPLVIVSTMRYGPHSAVAATAFVSLIETFFVTQGRGWIALTAQGEPVPTLQIMLLVLGAVALYAGSLSSHYRAADQALIESENRYRTLVDWAPVPILVHQDLKVVYANQAAARTLAAPTPQTLIGLPALAIVHPHSQALARSRIDAAYAGARLPEPVREQLLRLDAAVIEAEVATTSITFAGRPAAQVVFSDVTERVRAEDALRASEKRFEAMFQANPSAVLLSDAEEGRILDVNDSFVELFGYERQEAIGRTTEDLPLWLDSEARSDLLRLLAETGSVKSIERPLRRKSGEVGYILFSAELITLDGQKMILAVGNDISERRIAQQALEASETRHRLLSELMADVAFQGQLCPDNDLILDWVSGPVEQITGYTPDEFKSLIIDEKFIVSNDRQISLQHLYTVLGGHSDTAEYRIIRADGGMRWLRSYLQPVFDDQGNVTGIMGAAQDITERRELEDQLMQAQKMEAVGRLAGGIAHDFNNLLTVINGYAELISAGLTPDQPLHADMQEVLHAGQRAAELTRQLLAFSRSETRQVQQLGMNQVIKGMRRMLERLIREDIQLDLDLAPDLGLISADPTQIEQVIMNLVINARDAMSMQEPPGGMVTIHTENLDLAGAMPAYEVEVAPGRYVVLSVQDTGVGMTQEVREHLFEPFFTTKDVGQGTGLGLATIYGIVRQNNGFVQVQSKPGQGSVFRIGWPRVDADEHTDVDSADGSRDHGGQGTVLVVEDAPSVRKLASALLSQLGYHVLTAESGAAALQILRENGQPVDLLLTDLIMPEMGGRECAELACQMRPGLPVLYMSGYSYNVLETDMVQDADLRLLQKPFTRQQLAEAVLRALGG